MCGGAGTRFWPMSTKESPKQFLKLVDDKSLFQLTLDRLLKVSKPENIIIVTSSQYKNIILSSSPKLLNKNILCEPSSMNTASSIYFASKFISLYDSNATIGVYPSDHYIKNVKKFTDNIIHIENCLEESNDKIFTIGIKPDYPSTSYGYIECENNEINSMYKVSSFKEKPNLEIAKQLIKDDNYVWNSGMFFFKVAAMINEIDRFIPEIKNLYKSIDYNQSNFSDKICDIWDGMPKISIDYAVMEKSNNVHCMKSEFGWIDLGTWSSLYDFLDKTNNNNVHKGNILSYDAKNNLVISDSSLISIVGLSNIGVINHKGKILIIKLDQSENVRHILSQLDDKDK